MLRKIAPDELIRKDFRYLQENERLLTTPDIEEIIFMQSMEGRAHNGAGAFNKMCYVNTTMRDIVRALGRDPVAVKQTRQRLIDEIIDYARRALSGEGCTRLVNAAGDPLLGVPFFLTRNVDPAEVLRGLYFGGLRDSICVRRATEERYRTVIGYGTCYLVDTVIMDRKGLDAEVLAHEAHAERIEGYRADGLIVDLDRGAQQRGIDEERYRYLYIRHKVGSGQSDDAALIVAGRLFGVDMALGVFLADAIDTLEKFAPWYGDQDVDLACRIRDDYPGLRCPDELLYEMTYLSSIPEGMEDLVPDSSLRYLLAIDRQTGQSTIKTHLNCIEGLPYYPLAVSYKRIVVSSFYAYLEEKIRRCRGARERGDGRSRQQVRDESVLVAGLKTHSCIVITPDLPLREVISRLIEQRAEYAVLQDADGRITGVLTPSDVTRLFEG